ncbi:MAG: hypothetical protein ABI340_03820 [Nitrososphaera sp.]|jgi:hypothetical protein
MSNPQLKFGLVAFVLSSMVALAVSIPAASALTPRDLSILNDAHHTERFPGGVKVCGDHVCSADEWSQMKHALRDAQRNPADCSQLKEWKACGVYVKQSGQ